MTACGPVGDALAELEVVEDVPEVETTVVCELEADIDPELEVVPPVLSEVEVIGFVVEVEVEAEVKLELERELELVGTTAEVLSM